jgi:SAM-dependent methyltransferase
MAKQQHPTPTPATDKRYMKYVQANRTLWDAWTKLHLQPGVYGVEEFRAGETTLKQIELGEVGDVAGKTLLHLQCHFGLDTLSWARRGAIATGVDLSPEAITAARALSAETNTPARFVCADLYTLPETPELRGERFDVVFTSYGVLGWLPDLGGWARVIAHFLKPGGSFYMVEFHPLLYVVDPETHDSAGNVLDHRYFYRPEPVRATYSGTYAVPEGETWTTAYFWDHPLGDVVTALCDAGLRIEFLHEHPKPAGVTYHASYADDLPYLFSVRATAPRPRTPDRRPGARRSRSESGKTGRTKYYWEEHEHGYQRAEREGLAGWNELHGGRGFENFSSRAFLERGLPLLDLPAAPEETDVLEYGCGTGPGACFLAARGFRVDAVDLSPTAIKLARRFAAERGLTIEFAVQDVCAAAEEPPRKRYDVIVDSYCLQSVVTDEDRAKLFAFVRARLKPSGYYLISTAMYDPERSYDDPERYDPQTGIVYDRVRGDPERYEGAVQIGGTWCLPNRRHLTPPALNRELESAGFRVLWQGGALGGDVIGVPQDGTGRLKQAPDLRR